MKINSSKINIASLGSFDLELPILQCGEGSPKLLIINNLHGNELTGFYVLERFLANLENIQGTLTVITTANPLGLLHKQRLLPLDFTDLNRGYPPLNKERGIQVALKEKLIELGMAHDIIFDLHTFLRPSLSAGLLLEQANESHQKTAETIMRVLGTDMIFKMNISGSEEKRVASAFDTFMTRSGKLTVVVEYVPVRQATSQMIHEYAEGLDHALAILGLTGKKVDLEQFPPKALYERQQIISRKTGLFIPEKNLGDEIHEGDTLGFIMDVQNLQKEPLESPYDGMLTEIAGRELYVFGEKLVTIGKQIQ